MQDNLPTAAPAGACTSSRPRRAAWPAATSAPAGWPSPATSWPRVERVLGAPRPRPACTCSSPPAAPASRSTPCASSATARRASRATPWPRRPPPGAPRSRWSPPSTGPVPAGVEVVPGRDRRRDGGRGAAPAATPPTWSSWPPRWPTSGPRRRPTRKIKKADGVPDDRPRADPRHPRRPRRGASAPGQTLVGFAAETDDVVANAARQAAPARASTSSWPTTSRAPGVGFEHDTNEVRHPRRRRRCEQDVPLTDKRAVARAVLDAVARAITGAEHSEHAGPSPRSR